MQPSHTSGVQHSKAALLAARDSVAIYFSRTDNDNTLTSSNWIEALVDNEIITEAHVDEWGNVVRLRNNGDTFDFWSAGSDGIDGTDDDIRLFGNRIE